MDNSCRHQVPEVIGLEVQTRGKGVLLVFTDLDASSILRVCMGVDASITLRDNDGRMDITIVTLGKCYLLNELIHQGVNLRVLGDSINGGTCLQPFIHVTVVEGRTMVLALYCSGSHFKVAETVTAVQSHVIDDFPRRVPSVPHVPDTRGGEHVKTVAPEATSPFDGSHRRILHLGLTTVTHVCQSLCRCCSRAAQHDANNQFSHIFPPLAFIRSYQASRSLTKS